MIFSQYMCAFNRAGLLRFAIYCGSDRFYIVQERLAFLNGFMLGRVFHVHNKINHIEAFTLCFAVRRKTKSRMGFVIHLQARAFVIVKRAAEPQVFVGLELVMVQDLGKGKAGFDFGDCHGEEKISFCV